MKFFVNNYCYIHNGINFEYCQIISIRPKDNLLQDRLFYCVNRDITYGGWFSEKQLVSEEVFKNLNKQDSSNISKLLDL